MAQNDEEPFRQLLKDFIREAWVPAADSCEYCKAKYNVRIKHVNASGTDGIIEWDVQHGPDCSRRFYPEEAVGLDPETSTDMVGWTFSEKLVHVCGKNFHPLISRGNIGPCLNCGRLVIGVPLILFLGEGRDGQLDFCWNCAEGLGLLKALTKPKGGT